jgi:DNA-binding GntR family transcriptional regulator
MQSTLKITYNNETRRIRIAQRAPTIAELHELSVQLFPALTKASVQALGFTYIDLEQDVITIVDDADIMEAARASNEASGSLRIKSR